MCKSVKVLFLSFVISMCMVGCAADGNDEEMNSNDAMDSAEAWQEDFDSETESLGVSEGAEISEDINWQEVFEVPTNEEVAAYTNPNNSFAPCLAGWLSIPDEARYSEYSIEFKADYIPEATYWCVGQWSLDYSSLEEKYAEVNYEYSGAYGGFQNNENGMETIIAFWDVYCRDESGAETVIRAERVYPTNLGDEDFGGEGEGAHCLVPYEWEAEHWYRMHVKCIESQETGSTLVEQWVCDLETDEWTLLCIYDLKAKDVLFMSSPAIFMENYLTEYAGGVRSMEVRNVQYFDVSTGSWENVASAYISSNGGVPEYDGSYNFGTFQDRIWMICSGVGGDWYNNGKGRTDAELTF